MSLLQVQGLTCEFGGVRAVSELGFTIDAGRIHALIGPNGAGKTTLLNLLTGIYAAHSGSIHFDQVDVTRQPVHVRARLGVARTFQNLQVFFNMTALENVMTGRHRHERAGLAASLLRLPALRKNEHEAREESIELLAFVGIDDYAHNAADALPYGVLKRLEIARALASRPRLLLLDEPAAGLNPTETAALDALMRRLVARGITVILVEHNMRLVMGLADHILVLEQGRLLAAGDPQQVRNDPRVIEAYLGRAADRVRTTPEAGVH